MYWYQPYYYDPSALIEWSDSNISLLVSSLNALEAHFLCLMKSQVTQMKQVLHMPELQQRKQNIKWKAL